MEDNILEDYLKNIKLNIPSNHWVDFRQIQYTKFQASTGGSESNLKFKIRWPKQMKSYIEDDLNGKWP